MSNKVRSSSRVCWVSSVGDDPVLGGGVARAVSVLKASSSFDSFDYYSLVDKGGVRQILFAFKCVFLLRYRFFMVHSFFSPFSLFILFFSYSSKIVLFPHGEFRSDATKKSYIRKRVVFFLFRFFRRFNRLIKKVKVISTSEEEILLSQKILPVSAHVVVPDVVDANMLLGNAENYSSLDPVNLVIVTRLVPSKGVSVFLRSFCDFLSSKVVHKKHNFGSIYIFYSHVDENELSEVRFLSSRMFNEYGVAVNVVSGLRPNEIKNRLSVVKNRQAVCCSFYESFSYQLVESLGFEFKPLVWFHNPLVNELVSRDMCIYSSHGTFPYSFINPSRNVGEDFNKVSDYLSERARKDIDLYHQSISSFFKF